jgi:hypothetical protein
MNNVKQSLSVSESLAIGAEMIKAERMKLKVPLLDLARHNFQKKSKAQQSNAFKGAE